MFDRAWSKLSAVLCALAACAGAPGSSSDDGGMIEPPDGAAPALDAPNVGSRCIETATTITCSYETATFPALLISRSVRYQIPLGTPPPGGWPVVFYFQGSLVPAEHAFHAERDALFGQFQLVRTIAALLDHGYAVIAPDSLINVAWQTNIPPYSLLWPTTSDHAFLTATFAGIRDGKLGPLDGSRMYAMGISSGGYMTSRMAVSYPGVFRALAVHSASYATCGVACILPGHLPDDHPPTLFVHGGADPIVRIDQMKQYRDQLLHEGHVVSTLIDDAAGHEWLAGAVPEVRAWFDAHP